jgi:NADH-quinone oxidoreductase subunit M
VAVTAIVLAAVYMLWMYQRTMTGPTPQALEEMADLHGREIGVVAPLVLGLVLFGFYPMPLLDVINPYVESTLSEVGVTDEPPVVPAVGSDPANDPADGGQE